jgi:TRAF3-interacting protein 1
MDFPLYKICTMFHVLDFQVIKETGFLDGLYTEDELNSDNVKDRDAKIQFLDKLISVVSKCGAT